MSQPSVPEYVNVNTQDHDFVTFENEMNAALDSYEAGGTVYMDKLERLRNAANLTPVEMMRWFEAAQAVRRATAAAQKAAAGFEVKPSW